METGFFYYIKDEYYEKFENCNLMGNKESDEFGNHNRPCYYCFEQANYYWMIPISSRVEKFQKLYDEKMERYNGNFDGIRFGFVNGKRCAFLIQNICPITDEYVASEYRIQKNTRRVTVDPKLARELNAIVRKVLRLYFDRNIKIVLTDIATILSCLEAETNNK